MNKNILFYGNCQTDALMYTINFRNKKYIPCWFTNIDEKDFLLEINKADIIITQPINHNYRDKTYLSTSFIINNSRNETIIIIFPSLQLDFYYFDLSYKFYNGEILNEPSDYHYNEMINCIKNNQSVEFYNSHILLNKEFKTKEELLNIFNISINELKKREILINEYKKNKNNVYTIYSSQFIEENYLNKLLFWSINHPTKYLFHFIALEVLKILNDNNITINYEIDILKNERCILYKCLENCVNFDLNEFTPRLSKYNETNIDKIINIYYDFYNTINKEQL
jgi:hypothetical protein